MSWPENQKIELAKLRLKCVTCLGATTGVLCGQDSNIVRNMGKWKSCSICEEHYVHTIPPADFTDKIINL